MLTKTNSFHLNPYVKDPEVTLTENDEYIITREMIDDYVSQNDGVVKITKVVEKNRVNRFDYIQSFQDEVGLENILRKVAMTGDETLLDQTHRVAGSIDEDGKERIVDYTGVPTDVEAAVQLVKNGHELFANIPEDLKANRSFIDFVEGCTDSEVKLYLKKVLAAQGGNNSDE